MVALSPTEPLVRRERDADVSLLRLYALRGTYLLVASMMGTQVWPLIIRHTHPWDLMHGVAMCMLGAVTALCVLGIRYPLQMLPLLFVETVWKATWLIAIAYPLWIAHRIDADTADTIQACLMGVIFPIVIPWRYVFESYVTKPGDRWR